jgi:hypothetical protein
MIAQEEARRVEYHRPWLYAAQQAALFHGERYGVVEASTKAGKTVGCIAWLVEQAWLHGKPGRSFWWIAPVYPQAAIGYRRTKRGLVAGQFTFNETDMTVTLLNGARICFKSAERPDNLYGEDVYGAVIDEASRVREESWHAVRSTLTATRAPVRIIGNVRGRKNWCYRLARRAEAGEPGMHYAKLTADDAIEGGVLVPDEIEDAKRVLPEAIFRELYYAEPSDDGGNPFGLDAIAACVGPFGEGAPIAFGVDLAKSVDWTVVVGLDVMHRVCAFDRFQRPWEDTVTAVAARTTGVPTLVDSTGVGDPILEALQKRAGSKAEGFKFTGPSKQQLMEGLALAIQQGHVVFPDGVIRHELEAFEYQYTRTGVRYSAPEGMHDDCVCALALVVQQAGHRASVWAM